MKKQIDVWEGKIKGSPGDFYIGEDEIESIVDFINNNLEGKKVRVTIEVIE
jgi:hypothetical protein